jgi:hypothetical protein
MQMKKIMQSLLTLCLVFSIYNVAEAQVRKIPAEVTEAFKSKYASASNVEWHDHLTGFTAAFDMNSTHYEAKFTNKGVWQSTENKIDESELPQAVKDGFQKSKYADDWKIKEVYNIAVPDNKTQYRLEVKKGDIQKKNLLFNSEGKLLKDNLTL